MVEIASALVTAGLSLAQKLIMSWIERGRSRVKVAEVNSSIAKEAAQEAERLRVRVDDLEHATHQMMREIVARSPQLSYSRRLGSAALDLQFDPRNPASSKQMISDLRARVAEISADVSPRQRPEAADEIPVPEVVVEPRVGSRSEQTRPTDMNRSAAMIDELRDRVREAEDPRK